MVVTSREAKTITGGVFTAEVCLALFGDATALQRRHEVLSPAARELLLQKTSGEARI
jgi:hypothetical protein